MTSYGTRIKKAYLYTKRERDYPTGGTHILAIVGKHNLRKNDHMREPRSCKI